MTDEKKPAGILDGYRVIDCSIAMAGPLAAQRLGDLGAEVIKVEPVAGEWQRYVSAGRAQGERVNVSFLSLNRNKKSIALDLKSESGRAILGRLVETADVFLQNYRPGVAKRLAVDYETLNKINSRLVYVSISGFGDDGPYMARPGQDLLLQGMSGAMMSSGAQGTPPQPAGQFLVDAVTAYTAFEGALAALLHRERSGEGQLVSVNMLDSIIAMQIQELSVHSVGGVPQARSAEPHAHSYIRAPYGVFATADHYLVLAFAPLAKLGELIGETSFSGMDDETDSWDHRDAIFARVRERLQTRTTAKWLEIFEAADIWAGPVYGYADVIDDPQVRHNGSFIEYEHPTEGVVKTPGFPIRFSKTPSALNRPAPVVGQHSREVLTALGLGADEIDGLLSDGVIGEDTI